MGCDDVEEVWGQHRTVEGVEGRRGGLAVWGGFHHVGGAGGDLEAEDRYFLFSFAELGEGVRWWIGFVREKLDFHIGPPTYTPL